MKKRVLLITLIFLGFIICDSVQAATKTTSFEADLVKTGDISIPTGAADPEYGTYTSHTYSIKVGNESYDAYCIDPGAGIPSRVTCELIDESAYPMIYRALNDAGVNGAGTNYKDILYRTLGIMERGTVNYNANGADPAFNRKKNNVILTVNWHQALYERGVNNVGEVEEVNKPFLPNEGTFTSVRSKLGELSAYWDGNVSHVTAPSTSSIGSITPTASLEGQYFKLTKSGKSYTVTTKNGVKATDVTIKPDTGTVIKIEQEWNGTSAKFSFTVSKTTSSDCKGKVTITGVIPGVTSAATTPYICDGHGATQSYVALLPGPAGDKFISIPVAETDDCGGCTEQKSKDNKDDQDPNQKVEPDDLGDTSINLCCNTDTDSTESYLKEKTLNELFIASKNSYIGATYYTDKCNNSYYEDAELEKKMKGDISLESGVEDVESYCKIICREEIYVQVPGPITSATGKYFKLREPKAPTVKGKKDCRLKIDYRTLRAHYERAVNGKVGDDKNKDIENSSDGEVYWYNQYQKDKVKADLINNPDAVPVSNTFTPPALTFKKNFCTKSKKYTAAPGNSVYAYNQNTEGDCSSDNTTKYDCPATATKNCEWDGYESEEKTKSDADTTPAQCTTYYNIYEIEPKSYLGATTEGSGNTQKYVATAYQVKANDEFPFSTKKWKGLEIKLSSTTVPIKYARYSYYNMNKQDCDTKVSAVETEWTGKGWTKSGSYSYEALKSDHRGYTKQDPQDAWSKANTAASETDYNNFDRNRKRATDLENIVAGCNKFIDTPNADEQYNFKLSANFHYLQVFLNASRKNSSQEFRISFGSVSCNDGCTCSADTGGGSNYSSDYFKSQEDMTDLILGSSDKAIRDEDDITSDNKTAIFNNRITKDISYTINCKFPDPSEDGAMTLYPGPTFSRGTDTSGEMNVMGHKYQYAVYLTTYSASFETWWDIRGLGSKRTLSKFVKAFNEKGSTCAEAGNAWSKGTAEALKNSSSVVPFTCTLNIQDGGMRIGSCNPIGGISSNFDGCKPWTINEVYEFRVVDPANIFPGGRYTDPSSPIAKNWKKTDGNFGRTYSKIQQDAKNGKTYSPDNLTYAYKLTTDALKSIKKYNNKFDYNSFDKDKYHDCNCYPSNDSSDDGKCGTIDANGGTCTDGHNNWKYTCGECKSKFLTELSGSLGTISSIGSSGDLGYKVWNNKDKVIDTIRGNDRPNNETSGVHWATYH